MDQQPPTPPSDNVVPQVAAPSVSAKQQFVEKVTGAKNVLVTVGANPTVDELAAALGLTFLLGKLQKHVTAVFSGKTPPAIDFLDPDKTFERTVDSLRDFIIALDKEKADKLRYKVEDEVVKVFITPYRTTITEKDLQFSQGDFNVDVIVALGITKKDDLDAAIVAHGRILHDAEVITVNAGDKTSNLGSVDWADAQASSISEMLVSVSESFGSGLLDEQISTALLTGIVAETNRFSNEKTTPKVMTMAAQMMAAGANQQLIATNLRQEGMISESVRSKKPNSESDDGEMVLSHGDEKLKSDQLKPDTKKPESKSDQKSVQKSAEVKKSEQDKPGSTSKPVDAAPVATPKPVPEPPVPNSEPVVSPTSESVTEAPSAHTMLPPLPETPSVIVPDANKVQAEKPEFGGTLNATTGQAEADRAEELDRERQENTQALEHGAVGTDTDQAGLDAIEAARRAIEEVAESSTDPANNPTQSVGAQELPAVHEPALPELPALPAMDSVPSPDGQAGHMQAQTSVQNSASEAVVEEPSPVDAFMQPHQDQPQAPNSQTVPFSAPGAAPSPDMPPLPPLPPMPGGTSGSAMPPLPPMPGQSTDPTAGFQPDLGPAFMQGVPQSQNSWSQAADDMAAKQADKEANRQAKLDQMGAQYDAAVDQNLINQGKPPINNPNDHSTFPLPPTS